MQQLTVIRGTYLVPLEEIDALRDAHLVFLDGLVAAGVLLAAGRRNSQDGSLLLFRGVDADAALAHLADDPYARGGVASYESAGTFTPGRYAAELAPALS